VVYKIHGFLDDSSNFFSTSSILNSKVMDKLHERKIEIVSPTFMNQRRVDEKEFIPHNIVESEAPENTTSPEDLIFDKARFIDWIQETINEKVLEEVNVKFISLQVTDGELFYI